MLVFAIGCLAISSAARALPLLGGKEFRINTYTQGTQTDAKVVALRDDFLAVWESVEQDPDKSPGCYGQLIDISGELIGSEFRLNRHTTDNQKFCTAAPLENGGFVGAWMSAFQGGPSNNVIGQLFLGNASRIGTELVINTDTTGNEWKPSLATLPAGFVALWDGAGGQRRSNWNVLGQIFSSNVAKIGPEFFVNDRQDGWHHGRPRIAVGPDSFMVTWGEQGPNPNPRFEADARLFLHNGTRTGSQIQVPTNITGGQGGSEVAAIPSGFVIVWTSSQEDPDGSTGIYGQRFDFQGKKVGSAFRVPDDFAGPQNRPALASLPTGFVAAWDDQREGVEEIYARRFDGLGKPIEPQFRVNNYTAGVQNAPSVAALDSTLMFIWRSTHDPDGSVGIYGRIFTPIPPTTVETHTTSPVTSTVQTATLWPSSTSTIGSMTSSSDDSNGTIIALVSVIVGLVLSLCGGAGLFLHQKWKQRKKETSVVKPTPVYSEVDTQAQPAYSQGPVQEPIYQQLKLRDDKEFVSVRVEASSHYQAGLPAPEDSTAHYSDWSVIEKENVQRAGKEDSSC